MAFKDYIAGAASSVNSGPLAAAERARSENTDGNPEGKDLTQGWQFVGEEIDATRWNKSYPYQLLMLFKSGSGYGLDSVFTLPIPPEELVNATPFAISTTITLGGVVEEHNGTPLRNIRFSGTTGVTPLRGSGEGLGQASLAGGIALGTVRAAQNLGTTAQKFVGAGARPNLIQEDAESLKGTGYYQFRMLQRFLENYAARKKAGDTNLRLALAVWKDEAVYLVTPREFVVSRNASRPWEYPYSLSFVAWGRARLDGVAELPYDAFKPVARDPSAYQTLMNKLSQARAVLEGTRDVLTSVRADVDRVLFEPLRSVCLMTKDALGVAATAADLPGDIWADMQDAVIQAALDFRQVSDAATNLRNSFQDLIDLGASTDKLTSRDGTYHGAHGIGSLVPRPPQLEKSILEAPFEKRSLVLPGQLDLPPRVSARISAEKERVRQLTRLDFENFRNDVVDLMASFADSVSMGDTDFDSVYNRTSTAVDHQPTQSDYEVLNSLLSVATALDKLAASGDNDATPKLTSIDSIAGMAERSGIAFTKPVSKMAVPMPYGITLERLSAQYLGTPDRWHEIAALNGLREPYIDETGFDLSFQAPGSGSTAQVDSSDKLFLGQLVMLTSTGGIRSYRHISSIDPVPGGLLLSFDGEANLDTYPTGSTLHTWLPGTVNSQQLIYVPSDEPVDDADWRTKSIPGVDEFDPLVRSGGVDLLLNQDGDLVVTPDGDCMLAVGLTNIIQRLRTALTVSKGRLIHHPEYGLGLKPGVSTADLDAQQMKAAIENLLASDPAFRGVSGIRIQKSGPVVKVSMTVGLAGVSKAVPLTVDIRQS